MKRSTKFLIGGAAVIGVAAGGTGLAIASGVGDDQEPPITGPALDKATAAALDFLGEGRVTDTEVGDEDSFYEVEVTLDDGTEIDVQLDEAFMVVGSEAETGADEDDE